MTKTELPTILVIAIIAFLSSCDNDKCPEGSIPITDPQGFVIDCTQTFDSEEIDKTNTIEIQTLN